MSAYVMSEKDLAKIARALVRFIDENRRYSCRPFDNFTKELDSLDKCVDKVEFTYQRLYKLNLQSVNSRYKENNTEVPPMPLIEPWELFKTPEALIKKIACWQYQSCEDDEILNGSFYREMGEWAGRLAIGLVERTSLYQDSEW